MSIGNAMKRKGLGTGELADLSGVEAKNLSAYKNGSRTIGRLAATKLSPVLGESPTELVFGNRAAMLDRAMRRGDRRGALQACKGMVQVGEEAGLDDESLDQIVEIGRKFAAETASGIYMENEARTKRVCWQKIEEEKRSQAADLGYRIQKLRDGNQRLVR